MKSPLTIIYTKESVNSTAKLMEVESASAILIKVDGEFTGIVTERDFTRKFIGAGISLDTPLAYIMSFFLSTQ
jgi:signal-transduction protein with cAMP-binding, CBS, and nucleotidyltransferase domain